MLVENAVFVWAAVDAGRRGTWQLALVLYTCGEVLVALLDLWDTRNSCHGFMQCHFRVGSQVLAVCCI